MSAKLTLSVSFAANPRTWPLIDGRVTVEGVDLVITPSHPSEIFWRQLKFADFDISEMSMSSLMMTLAHGDDRFIGLPIFTTHRFFHTGILVRRDAGIETPADLKGKRVGVPEYQQTAALWTRGALRHEWGVTEQDMEWWMERPASHSHGGATGFAPPAGVTIHSVPVETSLGAMVVEGKLDAVIHYIVNDNLVDRSTIDLWNHAAARRLFPDPVAEGIRYFKKTGLHPINHGMVIKRTLAEKHPWVILNLMKAFDRANAIADRERVEHAAEHIATGLLPSEARAALARPVIRHGIKANRAILETCADYSREQGLTPRRMKLEEIFAPSTMGQ
ncbi:MAG TPA: ABC transporter substrate-binding protein [Xanthobacteraceae bacterium]|nr:ABC transporter substrate-binding protein [Xanthobacteraceae bacterium]